MAQSPWVGAKLEEAEGLAMKAYAEAVERQMVRLYESLSEKDRRRYAAVEALKLEHGGVQYIAELFDCDPHTIRHGAEDIEQLPSDEAAGVRSTIRESRC